MYAHSCCGFHRIVGRGACSRSRRCSASGNPSGSPRTAVAKVRDVVSLLNRSVRAAVLCVDEKSQVQTLDRIAPVLPGGPGGLSLASTPLDYFSFPTP